MKKIVHFIFSFLISFWCFGQTDKNAAEISTLYELLEEVDTTSRQVSRAYVAIKHFRDTVNNQSLLSIEGPDCADTINKDYYQVLFSKLLYNSEYPVKSLTIRISKLDKRFFENCNHASILFDTIIAQTDSTDWIYYRDDLKALGEQQDTAAFITDISRFFISSVTLVDISSNYVEVLFYEIGFDRLNFETQNEYIKDLVDEYNSELRSVGRRMGRVVLSAINEDPDYVTPTAQTRLDLARSDLDRVELFLKDAIYKRIQELSKPDKVPTANLLITNEGRNDYSYFVGASTNLKEALGFSTLFSWHKPGFHFDTGFDVYFRFVHEGDILIQPKLGIPIEDFHFLVGLIGSLNSSSNFNTTLTGNIYYSKKRLFAGVGFGQNTLLFTIGFVGTKTR